MNDRVRKIAKWLWFNKERLILVIMLVYLGMRVRQVFEKVEETQEPLILPSNVLPDDAQERQIVPPDRPEGVGPGGKGPPRRPPGAYGSLIDRNPFWFHAAPGSGRPGEEGERWDIQLLQLQEPVPGKVRARIRTLSATKWFDLGDSFEEYEIQDIDMAAGTCTVYSSKYKKSKVLEISP
ncbi:MAG TPA: hypothetical protein PKI11_00010 [Candidatus Hydrogenedentes bacterium]|nr:hypothetical protein [Candidatus Hydrogenedentota bacterium]